ncbi:RluA family pseudouridine synthase [Rheinheimera sp.]|jgi:tRNA pseudouridine32 synthase/23S rRNA pseudouridine746 synthase|uniref:RluA family pseudouridine synthase n=1 Tax=Rheinheimera sp. TaxID=1869214 RepID=UPI003D29FFDF
MLLEYRPPQSPYLDILYQDDALLVLNKPSGLLSVPGKALEHQDSLQWRVQRVFPTARTVHRLDMATSGLLVMALTLDAQRELNWQFERRQTQKHYIARLEGRLLTQAGAVDLPLICDWPNRPKQMVCFSRGKPAQTLFENIGYEENATRVRLTPVTGRSHQLRVHMQWLGHPICGDKFYGSAPDEKTERLQLHAAMLGLRHPQTGQWLEFRSPAPF